MPRRTGGSGAGGHAAAAGGGGHGVPDRDAPPRNGEPLWITVGVLGAAHGLKGELHLRAETDFPERLVPGRRVRLGGAEPRPATLAAARPVRPGVYVVRLAGVADRTTAERLRGYLVQVPAADLPELPAGRYYHHQLVGLRVVDEGGADLGAVASVESLPANDVYVVRRAEGRTWLLPATREVVREVDLAGGRMVVRPIPGLLD